MDNRMIRYRLRDTLEERGWSVRELQRSCEKSGHSVSYPTLLSLYHGKTKQIAVDTLNSVCAGLNCQVNKVIEYLPDE